MNKKYIVRLTDEERKDLEEMTAKGRQAAYKIKHAQILLKADADGPNWSDEKIAEAFNTHVNTARNVRQRLVELGLQAALERKKQDQPSRPRRLDGRAEAHLIALHCGQAPEGSARWTLKLLADRLVELEVVESVSVQTIRRTLKKTNSSRTCGSVG
jgi:transposase